MTRLFCLLPKGSARRSLTVYISVFSLVILMVYSVFAKFQLAPEQSSEALQNHLYSFFEREFTKQLRRRIDSSQIDFILKRNNAAELSINVTVWEGKRPMYDLDPHRYEDIRAGKEVPELNELYQKLTTTGAKEKNHARDFTLHRGATEYLFYITSTKKENHLERGLILLAGVLTSVLLIFLFSYCFVGATLEPLHRLRDSMRELASRGNSEGVFQYPDNEIGEVITTYNSLLGRFEELSRKGPAGAEELLSGDSDPDAGVAGFLQKKLFERPFPKLKRLEIALFPRNPSVHSKEFLSATGDGKELALLLGHFDVHNIETLLLKHRLQEMFLTLAKENHGVESASRFLYESMLSHIDFGPGFLFLKADPEEQKVRFYRSGPFFLFSIHQSSGPKLIEGGDSFFAREYDGIGEVSVDTGDTLLVVSGELLEIMDISPEAFVSQVLQPIGEMGSLGAKASLARLLKRATEQSEIEEFYGIINIVHFR